MNIAKWIKATGRRGYLNFDQIEKDTNYDMVVALHDNGCGFPHRVRDIKENNDGELFVIYFLVNYTWHSFTFNVAEKEVWYGRQTLKGWKMVLGYRDTDGT